ncbi:MAG: hypothetical protein Q7W02_28395 [Candidatus Rokubacteria bacterium]|nr:hypothetical protein [Candidatus Rokubacteria bacterium]
MSLIQAATPVKLERERLKRRGPIGRDLRALCATEDEVEVVERFLGHVCDPDFLFSLTLARLAGIRDDDPDAPFARAVGALASGFHLPADSTRNGSSLRS